MIVARVQLDGRWQILCASVGRGQRRIVARGESRRVKGELAARQRRESGRIPERRFAAPFERAAGLPHPDGIGADRKDEEEGPLVRGGFLGGQADGRMGGQQDGQGPSDHPPIRPSVASSSSPHRSA